jgi:hypothetical protein
MAKKLTGKPRFNSLQVMSIKIKRGVQEDTIEADAVFLDTTLPPGRNMCGSFTLHSGLEHVSKKSQELSSKLAASLEEDAARILFNETTPEEQEQEGIHVQEPQGIADAEEEGRQV